MWYSVCPQVDHWPALRRSSGQALGAGIAYRVPRPTLLLSVPQSQEHVTILHHPPVASTERRSGIRVPAQDLNLDGLAEEPLVAGLVTGGPTALLADEGDGNAGLCPTLLSNSRQGRELPSSFPPQTAGSSAFSRQIQLDRRLGQGQVPANGHPGDDLISPSTSPLDKLVYGPTPTFVSPAAIRSPFFELRAALLGE